MLQQERYYNDEELIRCVETSSDIRWRGQLVPSNFSSVQEHSNQKNNLYKCPQCPSFGETESVVKCIRSKSCCSQYYLVFQSLNNNINVLRKTCCGNQPIQCGDESRWYAVDASIHPTLFSPEKHMLPLQVELNTVVASVVSRNCARCVQLNQRLAGAAQWRSCATCCAAYPVDTDLVRDSLVRIGADGTQYWQYKPLARTEADRVHGIFGQSVFRGQGPRG